MANVTQLKDNNNNNIYPVTSDEVVFNSEGVNMKTKIINIENAINQISTELNAQRLRGISVVNSIIYKLQEVGV